MAGIKFDRTISFGHLITALTLALSVIAAYYSLREEVKANSMRILHVEDVLERDVKSINRQLDRIYQKLDD